jgi:hypothetical protein
MQQHDFDALIYEGKQRFNRSKKEEVVPRYILTSVPYQQK